MNNDGWITTLRVIARFNVKRMLYFLLELLRTSTSRYGFV